MTSRRRRYNSKPRASLVYVTKLKYISKHLPSKLYLQNETTKYNIRSSELLK